jgi:hypothetical protein
MPDNKCCFPPLWNFIEVIFFVDRVEFLEQSFVCCSRETERNGDASTKLMAAQYTRFLQNCFKELVSLALPLIYSTSTEYTEYTCTHFRKLCFRSFQGFFLKMKLQFILLLAVSHVQRTMLVLFYAICSNWYNTF